MNWEIGRILRQNTLEVGIIENGDSYTVIWNNTAEIGKKTDKLRKKKGKNKR